ncbi:MAG: Hsp20/alpha crystallin family protein [Microscillaceae bacterium]|nr:Hsp20/alpha crystallin family protein [Microscillaceae bacterium]MDW8461165.1 Hsp20/alpha crystallin family protein [Cytophagales bacterium]
MQSILVTFLISTIMIGSFDKETFKKIIQDFIDNIIQGSFDFEKEFRNFKGKDWQWKQEPEAEKPSTNVPPTNLIETPESFIIQVAAAGLNKENFSIQLLDDSSLRISYQTKTEAHSEDWVYKRREFDYTNFQRNFKLPSTADANEVSAKYEDGILEVTILKKETEKPKQVREIRIV